MSLTLELPAAVAKNAAPTFVGEVAREKTSEAIAAHLADDIAWEVIWWNTLSDSEREEYNERERKSFEAAEAQVASGKRGFTTEELLARVHLTQIGSKPMNDSTLPYFVSHGRA